MEGFDEVLSMALMRCSGGRLWLREHSSGNLAPHTPKRGVSGDGDAASLGGVLGMPGSPCSVAAAMDRYQSGVCRVLVLNRHHVQCLTTFQ